MTEYTYHVGEKFFEDGSVRAYPGNSVICFANPASPIYQAGEAVQKQLLEQPYGFKFALLPPSSFHMTVFSLILDQQRVPEFWSSQLPLDARLEDVDQFFISTIATVDAPQQLRMCPTYLGGRGLSIRLSAADEMTNVALVKYRNKLADATGVRYPDHDTYKFHLTLAYQLMTLSDDETRAFANFRLGLENSLRCDVGVFETEAPMLTFFDDMFRFEPTDKRNLLYSRQDVSLKK